MYIYNLYEKRDMSRKFKEKKKEKIDKAFAVASMSQD